MLISDDEVSDWADLQDKVKAFFQEMGYHAESPKTIELAGRGKKEVDVYVEDHRASVKTACIIECKWWKSAVPQDTVHGFHTVLNGCGANYGFIISKLGFQEGAKQSTNFTNITLLTFEGLQRAYGDEWFRYHLDKLTRLEQRLRVIRRSHFEQDSRLAMINSLHFRTPEQKTRLWGFELWNKLLLGLMQSDIPQRFDVEGPIEARNEPFPPWCSASHGTGTLGRLG